MSRFGSVLRRFLSGRGAGVPRPPRSRRRFGLWGPVPYVSTRTRRGSEVSVGGCGCCLPVPLLVAAGAAGGLRALWRRGR